MLWVYGLAGSGKSTLSTTIANIFRDSGQLGAFLFFDRDVTGRSDPTAVVRTLAHQLGSSNSMIRAAICTIIERNPNILMSSLSRQFQKLILDAFSQIQHLPPIIVIVLDALDECGTPDDRTALLSVLAQNFANLPAIVRTVVTSRAESDIYNTFEPQHLILTLELDITSSANFNDVLSYFQHRMALLRTKCRHLRLGENWPGEDAYHQLVQRASGLFVWASTASEFINGHNPNKRLDILLRGDVESGAETALDALYKTALLSVGQWDDEDFVTDFRNIIGIILVARQPIISATIDALLRLPDERPSMHTISLLGCVLQQRPTVRVLHPSFADFLMTKGRCKREAWFFDQSAYNKCLAFQCLDRMDAVLVRNMRHTTLSVDQTHENLSEDVFYSCLFWIDHVCAIEESLELVLERLRCFLNRHLLHWFEVMSILKRSRDTISLVERLLNWLLVGEFYIHWNVAY